MERLPSVTQQGSHQDQPRSLGCLSVCLSVKAHLPMDSNQGPSPFFPASGEGVTTWRELQGLCPEPLQGGGWAVRSPEQCQQPLLCVQSSQQMPELGGWKAPCFISLPSTPRGGTQQAAWRCRIYLSTWELKKLAHSVPAPGSSAGGLSQLPPGVHAGLRPSQKAGQEKPGDQRCLVWNPAAEFWLEPGNGLDAPYPMGEQGCGLLGSWPLGSAFTPGHAGEMPGEERGV